MSATFKFKPKNKNKWFPGAGLSHLPDEQRMKVEKLLLEECHAFSRTESDIGTIESLQLELNLKYSTPVWKT